MKKSLLATLLVVCTLLSASVTAQQKETQKLRWKGHETNKFWDNWEISAGFGNSFLDVATEIGTGDPGKFLDRNSWNANFAVTKWFVPIIGMRIQLDGGQYQNYSENTSVYGTQLYQTPYVFVHADVMINLSNWIGGYREDRVYYAIPYAGFGYHASSFTDNSEGSYNGQYAFTAGLLNKFRVCKCLDIQLDLRTWLLSENQLLPAIQQGGSYAFAYSASVGLAYRFNKRNWTKAYSQEDVDGYLAAIGDLNNRLNDANNKLTDANKRIGDANAENARLKDDLNKCLKSQRPVVTEAVLPETSVFFNIGSAKLTDYAKASLDQFVANVKDNNVKFTVTGYADKETGSAAFNQKLSEQRAKVVADYLIENGIDSSRILPTAEGQGLGSTTVAFPDMKPMIQRCVIIK